MNYRARGKSYREKKKGKESYLSALHYLAAGLVKFTAKASPGITFFFFY